MTGGPDVAELARAGVATIVATADAGRTPAVARAWGPVLSEDGRRLSLCVEAPAGSATEANLRAGGPVAVTLSRPTSYISVQLKGPVLAAGPPDAEAARAAAAHVEAFAAETSVLGVSDAVIRAIAGTELLHVELEIAERYDQTPGPGAGAAL